MQVDVITGEKDYSILLSPDNEKEARQLYDMFYVRFSVFSVNSFGFEEPNPKANYTSPTEPFSSMVLELKERR